MHLSSLNNMRAFREKYLAPFNDQPLEILDLGSTEMGACYRPIFDRPQWHYTGVDLTPGQNVDIVLRDAYAWREIRSGSIDVLISGQVLEHAEYFWLTALEISRVLKPGGITCLIAPSSGPEHRYPTDCWRFYPDGMHALAKFSRLRPLEIKTHWEDMGDPGSDCWHDSILVAEKPRRNVIKAGLTELLQTAQRIALRTGLRS